MIEKEREEGGWKSWKEVGKNAVSREKWRTLLFGILRAMPSHFNLLLLTYGVRIDHNYGQFSKCGAKTNIQQLFIRWVLF